VVVDCSQVKTSMISK